MFCTFLASSVLGSLCYFCSYSPIFVFLFFFLSYLPMNEVYLLWVTAICLAFALLWFFACFTAADSPSSSPPSSSCRSRNAFLLFGTQEVLWPGRQQTSQKFAIFFGFSSSSGSGSAFDSGQWPTNCCCWRQVGRKSGYKQNFS